MQQLTEEGRRIVDGLARQHGVTSDAVLTLLLALVAGGGTQAQFNHPDLGGMGQWSQGGMLMIGDMFNNALKAKVDALCTELAGHVRRGADLFAARAPWQAQSQSQSQSGGGADVVSLFVPGGPSSGRWWPGDLGHPSSTGGQNAMRYAFFPSSRRLAIDPGDGKVTIYDTGDHQITGFSQQQGGGQSITFTSQHGLVRVADLPKVSPAGAARSGPDTARHKAPDFAEPQAAAPAGSAEDIFAKIERLGELRDKGLISAKEFEAKKAELLARI
jgi:hypothetical protein